jgi:hypothetical protein
MNMFRLLVGTSLAIGLCGSAAYAATPLDGYKLKSGTVTVTSQSFDESHEFASTLRAFATPAGFTGGTVFLTEPGGGPSDGFTLVSDPTTGLINAYFISDGATASEVSRFVTSTRTMSIEETGSFQDVSAFFGQANGFAQITSDLDVPEPTIWALLILGFGAIGSAIRRHRSLAMFAAQ